MNQISSAFSNFQCRPAMGTLALLEHEEVNSESYHVLGLKQLDNGSKGIPRVLSLLASVLERLVRENENFLENSQIKDVITVFHGLRPPSLSIQQYIERIFKYSYCSPSCFVVSLIYLDRFMQRGKVHLTSLNVHRLLITSVMTAAKFVDDAFFNNAYYAKVGGISTKEMNRLELKLLFGIDFQLNVSLPTFGEYCSRLEMETTTGAIQIERLVLACRIKDSWSSKEEGTTCTSTVAR